MCVQVLQWLIVHADTIQSLLRSQELSIGALQELSLLTGIISKTALPGTVTINCYILQMTQSCTDSEDIVVHVLLGLSGALEVGGEVNSAALLEFQGHINRFQVQ